jgi:hypothetical protein
MHPTRFHVRLLNDAENFKHNTREIVTRENTYSVCLCIVGTEDIHVSGEHNKSHPESLKPVGATQSRYLVDSRQLNGPNLELRNKCTPAARM